VKPEMRDPVDLRLHPLQKKFIPEPDKDSAEWHSFVDGLSAAGVDGIPELFVTEDGQVMDGGRRWRAAKQLGWRQVRVHIRPESDAAALIVESLLGQRNMQRCAKVYIAVCLLPEFVKSAEDRRVLNLKNKVKTLEKPLTSNLSERNPEGTRAMAEKLGVSRETVRRALQVRDLFAADAELKAEWEPKLLAGEKNLWNVLSAVGGAGADQSKRDAGVVQGQMELFAETFSNLQAGAKAWKKFAPAQRNQILDAWRQTAEKLPQDLRDSMREVLDDLDAGGGK